MKNSNSTRPINGIKYNRFKSVSKLTTTELYRLKGLTVSDTSHMSALLNWGLSNRLFKYFDLQLEPIKAYTLLVSLGVEIIGWGVVQQNKKNQWVVSIFVKREFRKNKIGTEIYKRLVSGLKQKTSKTVELKYFTHDTCSRLFYKQTKKMGL